MNRGRAGTLASLSLLPLVALSVGCDALTARPFAGAIVQGTFAGMGETPAGQHLELWARDQYNDIIRINPFYKEADYKTSYGLMIRKAITLDDPCMIDDKGNLLTTAAAYPSSVTVAGVTQTPAEQAQQIVDRINQLNPPTGPLLAVLPYDPTPPPTIPANATPDERLMACQMYTSASDLTYVPNPYQITAPAHGTVYGFVGFVSLTPPANYDGYRLDTPVSLKGLQELFYTVEGPNVDPLNRGPLFMTSTLTPGGRDVLHFDLVHADPNGTASGTATVYTNLDEDPVQF